MAAYTTIDDPEAYFQIVLWTGDGGSSRSITLGGENDMQPDLVWSKQRVNTYNHFVWDSARGAGAEKELVMNIENAEGAVDMATYGYMSSFDSNGFSIAAGSTNSDYLNKSSKTYVAWCWKESADAGFDIVTYDGTGSARTISHSLSAVPHVMMAKQREDPGGGSNSWNMYHHKNTSAPNTDYLTINENSATADSNIRWNDTTPTSSVFTVGTGNSVNQDGVAHLMYLFSEKQGFSKFGSYTGNGNADGPFVYTGLLPAFILIKNTGASEDWWLMDNKREGFNSATSNRGNFALQPNSNSAENTNQQADFLSNGFKLRATSAEVNSSGVAYVYMAFAEAPFVNSNGVPCNAR